MQGLEVQTRRSGLPANRSSDASTTLQCATSTGCYGQHYAGATSSTAPHPRCSTLALNGCPVQAATESSEQGMLEWMHPALL